MHEIIQVGDLTVTLLKSGTETQGRFCLCELILPPLQSALLPHLHPGCDQMILAVAGTTVWIVGGTQTRLRPGERLFVPRGVLHECLNPERESARVACMYSPACVTPELFRELSLASAVQDPDRPARVRAVFARAGMLPA